MIYWKLFYNFLLIGCLSFGGGYGMISLVRETVLENGWLTETEFINFIAVSESTPGPLLRSCHDSRNRNHHGAVFAFFLYRYRHDTLSRHQSHSCFRPSAPDSPGLQKASESRPFSHSDDCSVCSARHFILEITGTTMSFRVNPKSCGI